MVLSRDNQLMTSQDEYIFTYNYNVVFCFCYIKNDEYTPPYRRYLTHIIISSTTRFGHMNVITWISQAPLYEKA